MKKEECPQFSKCGASLCPLVEDNRQIWFYDEEICHIKKLKESILFIQNQLVIRKLKSAGFFSKWMLNRNLVLNSKLNGILSPEELDTRNKAELIWIKEQRQIFKNKDKSGFFETITPSGMKRTR